jgi:hypothetical protein
MYHEQDAMKNYLKHRGSLPMLTERTDTVSAEVRVIGAYQLDDQSKSWQKTYLPVPPGTGIGVARVTKEDIRELMAQESGISYVGCFSGTDVPVPLYARHFGPYANGGTGEAYMGGVFGPSGSGKSVIAATIAVMFAKNPELGMLILDPQSEFSANQFSAGQKFTFDFHAMLKSATTGHPKSFDPLRDVLSIDRIQLDSSEVFWSMLDEKKLLEELGIRKGSKEVKNFAIRYLRKQRDSGVWALDMEFSALPAGFSHGLVDAFTQSYASHNNNRADRYKTYMEAWDDALVEIEGIWNHVRAFFTDTDSNGNKRISIEQLLNDVLIGGRKVIMDMNAELLDMPDSFSTIIMKYMLTRIKGAGHRHFKSVGNPINAMVLMDEAARYIPRDTSGESEDYRDMVKDITQYVREMRKYRIGFTFVTQNPGAIQQTIFDNLHWRIYGVGLTTGNDAKLISDKEGRDTFDLYRSLPDPRLSGKFSYLIGGNLLALGTSGLPMIVEGMSSDQQIMQANGLVMSTRQGQTGVSAAASNLASMFGVAK